MGLTYERASNLAHAASWALKLARHAGEIKAFALHVASVGAAVDGGSLHGGSIEDALRVGVGVGVPTAPGAGWRIAIRAWDPAVLGFPAVRAAMAALGPDAVDVRITGPVVAAMEPQTTRVRPVLPGLSVGHIAGATGTLGCYVRQQDGRICGLSNNHVLVRGNGWAPPDLVVQPGPGDAPGGGQADAIGQMVAFERLLPDDNLVDAALVAIDPAFLPATFDIPGIGRPTGYWSMNALANHPVSLPVRKAGRTTRVQSGRVVSVIQDFPVRYGDVIHHFDDVIEVIGSDCLFADRGDSGSLVVDEEGQAVGLLFAVENQAPPGAREWERRAFVCGFENVRKALQIELC
jgi:hypothetical protein